MVLTFEIWFADSLARVKTMTFAGRGHYKGVCAWQNREWNQVQPVGLHGHFAWLSEPGAPVSTSVYPSATSFVELSNVEETDTPTTPLLPPIAGVGEGDNLTAVISCVLVVCVLFWLTSHRKG